MIGAVMHQVWLPALRPRLLSQSVANTYELSMYISMWPWCIWLSYACLDFVERWGIVVGISRRLLEHCPETNSRFDELLKFASAATQLGAC